MANKIIASLQLSWLCFKLTLNLLLFGLEIFLTKTKERKVGQVFIIALLLLIWLGNIYIYNKKTTPQLEVLPSLITEQPKSVDLITNQFLLTRNEVETLLITYAELEKKNVKSLGLYLNLSQLESIVGNEQLAQKHLEQAKNIAP